jgi:hypothetical protein
MITFQCVCGLYLQVEDELANCKVRCPKCRAVSVAPPGDSPCPPAEKLPADAAPTVPSHHDLTIKPPAAASPAPPAPPQPHLPTQRKEKEPNS